MKVIIKQGSGALWYQLRAAEAALRLGRPDDTRSPVMLIVQQFADGTEKEFPVVWNKSSITVWPEKDDG